MTGALKQSAQVVGFAKTSGPMEFLSLARSSSAKPASVGCAEAVAGSTGGGPNGAGGRAGRFELDFLCLVGDLGGGVGDLPVILVLARVVRACLTSCGLLTAAVFWVLVAGVAGALAFALPFAFVLASTFALGLGLPLVAGLPVFDFLVMVLGVVLGAGAFAFLGRDFGCGAGPGLGLYL